MTARLRVNLSALAANYQAIASQVERAGAVVKADAYGLGAGPVSQALVAAGCRDFFVASPREALDLRAALQDISVAADSDSRIFSFSGPGLETAAELAQAGIIPVINSVQQLQLWQPFRALPLAMHVDTGMQRLGFTPDALQPALLEGYNPVLLMTHFACADDPDAALNAQQRSRFELVAQRFPGIPVSVGNSAASIAAQPMVQGLARPGIALYGGQPLRSGAARLQPVATFEAQVVQIREVPAHASVGYGGTWRAERATTVAIVGAGYADGIRRTLSNRGSVVAAGARAAIVGRVSMDLTAIDVTGLAVQIGDWVELFGAQLPITQVAAQLDTIDYEVLTSVGPRVRREYFTTTA